MLFRGQFLSPDLAQQSQQGQQEVQAAALQPSRRPFAENLAHHQAQVERRHVHQQALEDVGVAPQMHASHPAGFIQVGEAPFQFLAPLPQ